jgi:hypothetical protein
MTRLSGSRVWRAFLADPLFLAEVPEEQWPIFRPYARALPEILADLLDESVTLGDLLKAKLRCIRYCLDVGLVQEMIGLLPRGRLFVTPEIWIEMTLGLLQGRLLELEARVEDMSGFLEYACCTEEQAILRMRPTLSLKNLRRYRAGRMTIGDLLVSQPYILVRNE